MVGLLPIDSLLLPYGLGLDHTGLLCRGWRWRWSSERLQDRHPGLDVHAGPGLSNKSGLSHWSGRLATTAESLFYQLLAANSIVIANDDKKLPKLTLVLGANDLEDLGETLVRDGRWKGLDGLNKVESLLTC